MLLLLLIESGDHILSCTTTTSMLYWSFLHFPGHPLLPSLHFVFLAHAISLIPPFCLLRFPYSRGWDLRTVLLAIPRAATYLTQPRQSYLTRLQARAHGSIPPIHFFGHPSLQCSLASCLTCCCWGKYGYYGIIGFS